MGIYIRTDFQNLQVVTTMYEWVYEMELNN